MITIIRVVLYICGFLIMINIGYDHNTWQFWSMGAVMTSLSFLCLFYDRRK